MKAFFCFLVGVLSIQFAFGQALIMEKNFGQGGHRVQTWKGCQPINDKEFLTLVHLKGKAHKANVYSLERHSTALEVRWVAPVAVKENQRISDWFFKDEKAFVFVTDWNEQARKSTLLMTAFEMKKGEVVSQDTLFSETIGIWNDNREKGKVAESFDEAVESMQLSGTVVPLEFRFHIVHSPNGNFTLVYRYDFSQKELLAKATVFDRSMKKVVDGEVNIDRGMVAEQFLVNDRGQVIVVKSSPRGKIATVRVDLATNDFVYLEVQPGSSAKESIKAKLLGDDSLMVATLNVKNKGLTGVSFARLNFAEQRVTKNVFFAIPSKLKNEALEKQKEFRKAEGLYRWENFELVDFALDEQGRSFLLLEEQFIQADGFQYETSRKSNPKHWKSRPAYVHTGLTFVLAFDAEDTPIWQQFVAKHQSTGIVDGMNSLSVFANWTYDEEVRLIYAIPMNSATMSTLCYMALDKETGEEKKFGVLDNPSKLDFVRPYTFWANDRELIFVGRKGLLGKKGFIRLYKIINKE